MHGSASAPVATSTPIAAYRLRQPRWGVTLALGFLVFGIAQGAAWLTQWSLVGFLPPAEAGMFPPDLAGWKILVAMCVQAAVALALMSRLIRWMEKRPATEARLRGHLGQLAAGLALGAVLISVPVLALAALGHLHLHDFRWTSTALAGLGAGIGAGVAEEYLFRGTLLRLVEGRFGTILALALTSVFFGALHLINPGATAWTAVAIVLEAGVLLGACWILTQNLWFVIGVHTAWNAVQSGLWGVTVSGLLTQRGLFAAETSGPEWLTGGTAGVEGSVLSVVVCLATAIPLLVWAYRRGHFVPRPTASRRYDSAPRQGADSDVIT